MHRPVKCNSCDASADVTLDGGIPKSVICPECGASENYADFQQSIAFQATEYVSGRLNRALRDMARGNKNIIYKPGHVRSHKPKFRVDMAG